MENQQAYNYITILLLIIMKKTKHKSTKQREKTVKEKAQYANILIVAQGGNTYKL